MSDYPGAIDNFTPRVAGVDEVQADDVNELQDAIEAIETELGTDPAGASSSVAERLTAIEGSIGAPAWDDVTDKPSTFAPSAHASMHQNGGGDELEIDYSQLANVPASFTPSDHAGEHEAGGGDELDIASMSSGAATAHQVPAANGSGGIVWEDQTGGEGGGAPTDATYITLSTNASLSDERVLTAGDGVTITDGGAGQPVTVAAKGAGKFGLEIIIGDGVNVITTGVKGFIEIPFDCEIESVRLVSDATDSIVIDIWKDTYANFPPTVADTITASAKPTLSSARKSEDATLTGWTTTLSAGDWLAFNVDSAATVKQVTLSIRGAKS